ncbi:MAG: carotenoid biosynthesis protein [Anaerolineae bacterium]
MNTQLNNIQTSLYKELTEINSITASLMALWFVVMTAVPIAIWTVGPQSIPVTMLLGTVCQAAVVLSILIPVWGWQRTLLTFFGVGVMGWAAEYIGTTTGLPFGAYFYTDLLQPQIGHVPLLVPVAWFILLPACWRLAEMISGNTHRTSRWLTALIAAGCMVAWDLLLDPQMVNWGFWVWQDVPAISWFGIPFLNYFGWFLVSFLMTVILQPPSLKNTGIALWLVFAITWFLETFGLLFFWGLPGPAVGGGLIMGGFMVWSYYSGAKQS